LKKELHQKNTFQIDGSQKIAYETIKMKLTCTLFHFCIWNFFYRNLPRQQICT